MYLLFGKLNPLGQITFLPTKRQLDNSLARKRQTKGIISKDKIFALFPCTYTNVSLSLSLTQTLSLYCRLLCRADAHWSWGTKSLNSPRIYFIELIFTGIRIIEGKQPTGAYMDEILVFSIDIYTTINLKYKVYYTLLNMLVEPLDPNTLGQRVRQCMGSVPTCSANVLCWTLGSTDSLSVLLGVQERVWVIVKPARLSRSQIS